MQISKVTVNTSHIALKTPYNLSFTSLHSIKSNIITIQLENKKLGMGEVTALPGYGSETHQQINTILNENIKLLNRSDESQARVIVHQLYKKFPFSASAIGTALDFAYRTFKIPKNITVPLLMPISACDQLDVITQSAISAYRTGYRTLKVKIGKKLSYDIKTAITLLKLPLDLSYRFDANQGYSFDEALQFLNTIEEIDINKIELFEQPFSLHDWNSMEALCKKSSVPLMLDESIYTRMDIKRASDIGCSFIKLKLCKSKGVNHLINLAEYAKELGLKVVLGNGVSTDIGNFAEAVAFCSNKYLFSGAFEGNGFLKLSKTILGKNLSEKSGCLVSNSLPNIPIFRTRGF